MEKTLIKIQKVPFVCNHRNVEHWTNSMQWLLGTPTLHSSYPPSPRSTGEEKTEKVMSKFKLRKKDGVGEKCL